MMTILNFVLPKMRIISSRLLSELTDPKYDKTFKRIFYEPTNKLNTLQFIADVTKLKLKDLVYVNPSMNVENDRESEGVVDVLCESVEGDKFLVEMRRSYQRGFANRLLYYGSRIYSGQVMMGNGNVDYSALKKVIVIAIIDFPFAESYISCHKITNEKTSNCRFDGLKFYLIDLTKFDMKIDQLKTSTEVWCFYFKKIHTLDEKEINILEQKHSFIKPAVDELKKFRFSVKELQEYILYCMNNDRANTIEEYAEDKVKEKLIETAKKMLAFGEPIDKICLATGLKTEDFVD